MARNVWSEYAIENLHIVQLNDGRFISAVRVASESFDDFVIVDLGMPVATRSSNVIQMLLGAMSGTFYHFLGPLDRVLPLIHEIYYGLSIAPLDTQQQAEVACHFLFQIRGRRVIGLYSDEVHDVPLVLPSRLLSLLRTSDLGACYVPMFLIIEVGASMYGHDLNDLHLFDWSNERIKQSDVHYFDSILGFEMKIKRGVFIPDKLVGELFLKAALANKSEFINDVRGKIVSEPCTGSGYLGILIANLAAGHVVSSDIDGRSVENARENAARAGLSGVISHRRADGLPRNLRRVSTIVFNPPWIGYVPDEAGLLWEENKRRCMIDMNHEMLLRILKSAANRLPIGSAVWFALGAATNLDEKIEFGPSDSSLERTFQIDGRRGMTLLRYAKCPA